MFLFQPNRTESYEPISHITLVGSNPRYSSSVDYTFSLSIFTPFLMAPVNLHDSSRIPSTWRDSRGFFFLQVSRFCEEENNSRSQLSLWWKVTVGLFRNNRTAVKRGTGNNRWFVWEKRKVGQQFHQTKETNKSLFRPTWFPLRVSFYDYHNYYSKFFITVFA